MWAIDDIEGVVAHQLAEQVPAILGKAARRASGGELIEAFRQCAAEYFGDNSDEMTFLLGHAYLNDDCAAYQLPKREEISERLCSILNKKRNALHIRIHRFKPVWEAAKSVPLAA